MLAIIIFSLSSVDFSKKVFFLQSSAGITFTFRPEKLYDYRGVGLTFEGGINYFISDDFAITSHISYSYFKFIGNPGDLKIAIFPEYEISEIRGGSHLIESSIKLKVLQHKNKNESLLRPFYSIGFGFLTQKINDIEVFYKYGGGTKHLNGSTDKGFLFTFTVGTEIYLYESSVLFIEGGALTTLDANNYFLFLPIRLGIRF